MAFITKVYAKKSEILKQISNLWMNENQIYLKDIQSIDRYILSLRNDIFALIEYPYVDKVYRDTYYNYYSTKHLEYNRHCIRVNLFSEPVSEEDFQDQVQHEKIKNAFLGFFVIRPIPMHLWGRCVVSPKAFSNHSDYVCCLSRVYATVNGLKLNSAAFPHTSQDQETHSCAETTIWSIMEYFGNRYPEYKPVLPSKIIDILSPLSYQRQTPSNGLTSFEISYALKQFDFGVRLFDVDINDEDEPMTGVIIKDDFKRILAYYIESGIPVIGSISNNSQGHAIILIGRETNIVNGIDAVASLVTLPTPKGNLSIYDTADIARKYVINDDNFAPYRLAPISNITNYYTNPMFSGMKLVNLIVPIYHKIYTEPQNIRKIVFKLLQTGNLDFGTNELVLHLHLSSSRSYKNQLLLDRSFHSEIKGYIVDTPMPKFIWVAELSDKPRFKNKKAIGLLVFDATELYSNNSLLFVIQPNKQVFRSTLNDFETKTKIGEFNLLQHNLKGDWNQWQQ